MATLPLGDYPQQDSAPETPAPETPAPETLAPETALSDGGGDQWRERDFQARLWLSLCVPPGDPLVGGLVATLGAVRVQQLVRSPARSGLSGRLARQVTALQQRTLVLPTEATLQRVHDAIARSSLQVLTPADREWPPGLGDLGARAPLLLCVRGVASALHRVGRQVAIVGTRTPSLVALSAAREIAWHQITAGRTIVSGGAKGIDAVGHLVSLESGVATVAVLAQSPDRPYPVEHRGLFDDIAQCGAVVSEVLPGVSHGASGFLARNRLIAALASLTIVVEAPIRSGAISTAAHAAHLDRAVMAVVYEQHEADSGSSRLGVQNGGQRVFPVDNRGAERVLEQWAGEAIHWPALIREKD